MKGWKFLRNLTWNLAGDGFFASHPSKKGVVLLAIDMRGNARVIWELAGQNVFLRALPSLNGRQVAILGSIAENNVWELENF